MLLTAFYATLSLISGGDLRIVDDLIKTITGQGIDSLWFIPCFFFAELLLLLAVHSRLTKSVAAGITILSVILITVFSGNMPAFWLFRVLIKIAVGFSFAYIGYWIDKIDLIHKIPVWCGIILLAAGAVVSHFNGFVGIGALDFQNGVLFFIDAVITSVAVLVIFCFAEKKLHFELKPLSYYGKNSIVLLCTNNLLIEAVRLLDHKLTGDILIQWEMIGSVLLTVLLLAAEALIIKISMGKLGILFGKKGRTS